MTTPLALQPPPEFCATPSCCSTFKAPSATWKRGDLALGGLPKGPATWALRDPGGRMLLRGWVSTDSGNATVQLPFESSSLVIEIHSGSNCWCIDLPQKIS